MSEANSSAKQNVTKFTPETHMFRNVTGAVIHAITVIGSRLGVTYGQNGDPDDLEINTNSAITGEDLGGSEDYDLIEKPPVNYWSSEDDVPESLLRIRRKDGTRGAQLVINANEEGVLMTNDASYPVRVPYSQLQGYEWDSCDNPGEWEDCVCED